MNEKLARIPIMIASLLLSFGLWFYVQYQDTPPEDAAFGPSMIKAEYLNLGPELRLMNPPERISFTIPAADAQKIPPETLVAEVDLLRAGPGLRNYTAILKAPAGKKVTWRPSSKPVQLDIDPIIRKKMLVTVETANSLSVPNRRYAESAVDPVFVQIEGPKRRVDRITKARVILDLEKVVPGKVYSLPVELLNSGEVPVADSDLVWNPKEVSVTPVLMIESATRTLLLSPVFKGQPAYGYRVASYVLEPNQVDLKGRSEALAKLRPIKTMAIDLSGLKASKTFEVPLDLTPDLRASNPKILTVRVVVEIERDPTVPQNSPTTGSSGTKPPITGGNAGNTGN